MLSSGLRRAMEALKDCAAEIDAVRTEPFHRLPGVASVHARSAVPGSAAMIRFRAGNLHRSGGVPGGYSLTIAPPEVRIWS